jgi:hypothetical protein
MTQAERTNMEQNISQQWQQIKQDPRQLVLWEAHASGQPGAGAARECPIVAVPPTSDFASPCRLSKSPRYLLDHEALMSATEVGLYQAAPAPGEEDDPGCGCSVSSAVPDRVAEVDKENDLMFGCYTSKKICRRHSMSVEAGGNLDKFTAYVTAWVKGLSKEAQGTANELVAFVGADEVGPAVAFVGLLVLIRHRPQIQFWASCCGSGARSIIRSPSHLTWRS